MTTRAVTQPQHKPGRQACELPARLHACCLHMKALQPLLLGAAESSHGATEPRRAVCKSQLAGNRWRARAHS